LEPPVRSDAACRQITSAVVVVIPYNEAGNQQSGVIDVLYHTQQLQQQQRRHAAGIKVVRYGWNEK